MKNELMAKAWVHFDGVWPERSRIGIGKDEYGNSFEFIVGKPVLLISELGLYWHEVTETEFEAYGASLKPEYEYDVKRTPWISNEDTKEMSEAFKKLGEMAGEYMPEVGEECKILYSGTWRACTYKGKTTLNKLNIVEFDQDSLETFGDLAKFRPLKTEREKFVEEAVSKMMFQTESIFEEEELQDFISTAMRLGILKLPNNT